MYLFTRNKNNRKTSYFNNAKHLKPVISRSKYLSPTKFQGLCVHVNRVVYDTARATFLKAIETTLPMFTTSSTILSVARFRYHDSNSDVSRDVTHCYQYCNQNLIVCRNSDLFCSMVGKFEYQKKCHSHSDVNVCKQEIYRYSIIRFGINKSICNSNFTRLRKV